MGWWHNCESAGSKKLLQSCVEINNNGLGQPISWSIITHFLWGKRQLWVKPGNTLLLKPNKKRTTVCSVLYMSGSILLFFLQCAVHISMDYGNFFDLIDWLTWINEHTLERKGVDTTQGGTFFPLKCYFVFILWIAATILRYIITYLQHTCAYLFIFYQLKLVEGRKRRHELHFSLPLGVWTHTHLSWKSDT